MPAPLIPFEHKSEKVIPRPQFAQRMGRALLLWAMLTFGGLVIGMTGYSVTEGMGLADSFVNAAMILSGMGPVDQVHTTAGKLFAGFYAILSGLIIVIGAGFVLAPIAHRVLHRFHVETKRGDE
ncbi:hypothetical protein W911_10545 [Hyphomicrobium nitrativorans NL23]|uniref:Potassium channel domain-containing protein n=1 Tax=Hyphomicrobium nitrativorans NL23 TaxID=1029756 RepID=V5SFJ3_9HYPH|nr:hypothetical protein [Hyphomicrobium nitrativorans]AHB48734.1 hypothetical protein W911_10545 [Hyphomicrobium nitrativorans NL23]